MITAATIAGGGLYYAVTRQYRPLILLDQPAEEDDVVESTSVCGPDRDLGVYDCNRR